MKKHTPGPWIAYDNGSGMRICPEAVQDALIPHVAAVHNEIAFIKAPRDASGEEWDAQWEVCKANARLMAAAPELLGALEQAVYYFNQNGGSDSYTWLPQLEAALAKAKGGAK